MVFDCTQRRLLTAFSISIGILSVLFANSRSTAWAMQPFPLAFIVADQGAGAVFLLEPDLPEPVVLLTGLLNARGLVRSQEGDIYVIDSGVERNSGQVWHIPLIGEPSVIRDGLDFPEDIAIDPVGNLAITEIAANRVIYFTPGSEETRELGQFNIPSAITYVDESNNAPAPGFIISEWLSGGLYFVPLDGGPTVILPLNRPSVSGLATAEGRPILATAFEQQQILALSAPDDDTPVILVEGLFANGPVRLTVGASDRLIVSAGPNLWNIPLDLTGEPSIIYSGKNLTGVAAFAVPLPPTPTPVPEASETPAATATRVAPTATPSPMPTATDVPASSPTAEAANDATEAGTESGSIVPPMTSEESRLPFGLTVFGLGMVVMVNMYCLAMIVVLFNGLKMFMTRRRARNSPKK